MAGGDMVGTGIVRGACEWLASFGRERGGGRATQAEAAVVE